MKNVLDLFQRITNDLLVDEKENPVAKHIPSAKLFDTLDLSLKSDPLSEAEFEKVVTELVFASPRTATTGFFNQLFGGRNPKAILGELLSVILNNSMYTYKAAGPQIGVEKVILREICDMIGWDENSDGTLAPGGSMTNFMSMVMARDAASSKVVREGMQQKMIDLVVVGADRIAANGDAANKIGTYSLAIVAQAHNIPFYVAAPFSTIDFNLADGSLIPIEQRDPQEISKIEKTTLCAEGAEFYNPAFDVTPANLITAVITEQGAIKPEALIDYRNSILA